MGTNIQLDPEIMAVIASKAIFEEMDSQTRDSVLQQAITGLLTPPERSPRAYGSVKTPLQDAFDQAIQQAAFKAVREKIENDPRVQEEIEKLLGPLLLTAVQAEAEVFEYNLADKLGAALGSWLGEQARKGRD